MDISLIDYGQDCRILWDTVADWFLTDLYRELETKKINITLTMRPLESIKYLGQQLYNGQKRLYSWNRYTKRVIYPDFDTESTYDQKYEWKMEVWPDILASMSEISYDIGEYIKNDYDESVASDYLSLTGSVDTGVIYGIIYKTIEDPDNETTSDSGSVSDIEYEPDY